MSLFNKTTAVAVAAVVFSASAAFAQVGGGNEIPDAAKDKGTASGGTEGKSNMSKDSMKKDGGAMSKDDGSMKKDSGGKM